MSDELRYMADDEMRGIFLDPPKFVRAVIGNMVVLNSQIDKDKSGRISKPEVEALIKGHNIDKGNYCKMFGGTEHVERFDKLLSNIKTAIETHDPNAPEPYNTAIITAITASIEKTTKEQLPFIFKWAGPDDGEYRQHVEAALSDLQIVEASKSMVLTHDDNILDVCKLPQKERRPRTQPREK